jgi:UDP-glucose 4-epimerase
MEVLRGARFLVTGGAGFIGSTIVDQLIDAGAAEVRVIDNFVRGSQTNLAGRRSCPELTVVNGDIRDRVLVDQLTEGIDYVFHQAALRITRCAEAPREALEVLFDGSYNVIESAVKHGVRKLVAASSASVYGEPSYLPIDEEHPFNNRTMYGAGKIALEQMLRASATASGLRYTALRYFNVYGPRMDTAGVYTEVLIRWMNAIEQGTPPLIFGDGTQSMDFVYVDDVARANLLAACSDADDECLNVSTGVQTSLTQLAACLLRVTASCLQPEHRPARVVANVQSRRASVDRAAESIGFRSTIALEEGLRRLVAWKAAMDKTTAVAVEA